MLLYNNHFQELIDLGARYRIDTTVVEKQARVATGASFSADQTGMANTGIEDDIEFPLPITGMSDREIDDIKSLLSYKQRYDHRFGQNPEAYYEELKHLNLPGSVMFRRSVGPMSGTRSGQLDHSRAYLMRKTMGEEEFDHFNLVRRIANERLPFYKLNVMHSSLLEEITVSEQTKPSARLLDLEENRWRWLTADQIRMNTGTTLKHPVEDLAARDLTFCQSMNIADIKLYFASRKMLDAQDMVVPGTKILCGGLSLSSLDQLSVLNGVMNLFEIDDKSLLGYRVTSHAKKLYQGAITFISRTPGKACPPRHSFDPEWTQETPLMGNTKHLHSLFLHENGEEVYQLWYDILKATVARALNRTPIEMDKSQSTEELLRSRFEETSWFLDHRRKAGLAELQDKLAVKERLLRESMKTQSGAWRQAALSLILGFGPESDLGQATSEMEELVPITFKGRQTMLMHRAQQYSITHPRVALKKSNKVAVSNFKKIMNFVTASPVEIHSMFHLLFQAGIAKFVPASYSDISVDASGRYLSVGGEKYDALVVSPVFDRNTNPAVKSLAGQIRPMHPSAAGYGAVGKFRQFISPSGKPLPVEDNGLGGAGFQIREGDGKGSTVGAFAVDINNRASAASTAASYATRRMALAHLKAGGVSSPTTTLSAIYESQKPEEVAYDEEVKRFEKYFDEIYEMGAYLRAIEKVGRNDSNMYVKLYDRGTTIEGRKDVVKVMSVSTSSIERKAAEMYTIEMMGRPSFNPPKRDEYLERFVDTTAEEDKAAYAEAFRLAKKTLAVGA